MISPIRTSARQSGRGHEEVVVICCVGVSCLGLEIEIESRIETGGACDGAYVVNETGSKIENDVDANDIKSAS